jgi:hypothetical protein
MAASLTRQDRAAGAHDARVDPAARPGGEAALDLHKGISTPEVKQGGCPRWPDDLRLRSEGGLLVMGRCRATNLCDYCARLAAIENAEVLAIDALASGGPAVWAVLSTRTATGETRRFYASRRKVMLALKRRWPRVEYAAQVEFTTGYGTRSGGHRRPHWNLLLKGVDVADVDQVRDVITAVWCAREDAEPGGQFVGSVYSEGGLMRYLALHFNKQSQQPPAGWRGHRFLKSRGYFAVPLPELRDDARNALRLRREIWKLRNDAELQALELEPDVEAELIDRLAAARLEAINAQCWDLVRLSQLPTEFDAQGAPAAWEDVVVDVRTAL